MKLLTVTVPCYNSQNYMAACLDSLVAGGERVEVIVINDGSKDNTGAIADSYAEKYPNIIRVIHQENGGHGEGINQGLIHATGTYFKVVDSDDKVCADFPKFLDSLEYCEQQGGADLVVTNYFYTHEDSKGDRSIRYKNVFPEHKIFTWNDVGHFRIDQMISLHSATFRTEVMRDGWKPLPKHVSYEDNFMVCQTLPKTKRLHYVNIDLYLYTIGREGQSVSLEVALRKYTHHLNAARDCFTSCHLDDLQEKPLRKYMQHAFLLLLGFGCCFSRLNGSSEADANLAAMWAECRAFDEKWADYFRYRTILRFMASESKFCRKLTVLIYKLGNTIVRYN